MAKRSFKFYRQNEAEVMESLGLKPTKNSGSGWIEKEDGQNDYVICQLKSTDAQSIKVSQKDIRMLEKNAGVEHKIPVFAIQFLNTGEVWLMCKPEDIFGVNEYLKTGRTEVRESLLDYVERCVEEDAHTRPVIGSGASNRQKFHMEREKLHDKTKSAK
jgi:hypothetical protein